MKSDPHRTGRYRHWSMLVTLALSLLVIGGLTGSVIADHQRSTTPTLTGCLGSNNGQVYNLQAGDSPLRTCRPGDATVHLSGGDVTGVTAGDGLVGGGDSGDVDLAVNRSEFSGAAHDHDGDYVEPGSTGSVTADMLVDGPGSGIDADSVDTLHGSEIAGIDHTHDGDYLKEPGLQNYTVVVNRTMWPKARYGTFDNPIEQRAWCPPHWQVVGGGGSVGIADVPLSSSFPRPGVVTDAWEVEFVYNGNPGFDFHVVTYAICIDHEDDEFSLY